MFDIKKFIGFNKITIVIIIFILLLIIMPITYSRFFSSKSNDYEIETAYYVLATDYNEYQIHLDDLLPSDDVYTYNFRIMNNDGTNRTETKLEYVLKIITTTNLPLSYSLYMNEEYDDFGASNIIYSDVTDRDSSNNPDLAGAYFRTMTMEPVIFGFDEDEYNDYQLVISFPSEYDSIDYQDIVEGIFIVIDSKQIIDSDD